MESPFLRLPRELRDQIYSYIFTSPYGFITLRDPLQINPSQIVERTTIGKSHICIEPYEPYENRVDLKHPISINLVFVNRQINTETRNLLWHQNALCVPDVKNWDNLMKFTPLINQMGVFLAHIRIDLDFYKIQSLPDAERLFGTIVAWSHTPGSRFGELDIRMTRRRTWLKNRPQRVINECQKFVRLLALTCGGSEDEIQPLHLKLGKQVRKKLIVGDLPPLPEEWDPWSWHFPLNVEKVMAPGSILSMLHEAFQGELWIDGRLCYQNGVRIE